MNPFVVVFNLIQKLFPMKELPEKSELTVEVKTGFYPYQTYLQCSECKYTAPNTDTTWSGVAQSAAAQSFPMLLGGGNTNLKVFPTLAMSGKT